jgi:hypothetical protein
MTPTPTFLLGLLAGCVFTSLVWATFAVLWYARLRRKVATMKQDLKLRQNAESAMQQALGPAKSKRNPA